jgi:carbon storage regulator
MSGVAQKLQPNWRAVMLVLSRKKNEEILIGGAIRLTVLEIMRGRVKLGFTAPPEVVIRRAELLRGIEKGDSHDQATLHSD